MAYYLWCSCGFVSWDLVSDWEGGTSTLLIGSSVARIILLVFAMSTVVVDQGWRLGIYIFITARPRSF